MTRRENQKRKECKVFEKRKVNQIQKEKNTKLKKRRIPDAKNTGSEESKNEKNLMINRMIDST